MKTILSVGVVLALVAWSVAEEWEPFTKTHFDGCNTHSCPCKRKKTEGDNKYLVQCDGVCWSTMAYCPPAPTIEEFLE